MDLQPRGQPAPAASQAASQLGSELAAPGSAASQGNAAIRGSRQWNISTRVIPQMQGLSLRASQPAEQQPMLKPAAKLRLSSARLAAKAAAAPDEPPEPSLDVLARQDQQTPTKPMPAGQAAVSLLLSAGRAEKQIGQPNRFLG